MKKQTKMIAVISAICVLLTGTLIVLAAQENELDIPHEHEYQITSFDSGTGTVTFTCDICEETQRECFADHLNERGYEALDMNQDGIVNAKDYGYLIQNYGNQN